MVMICLKLQIVVNGSTYPFDFIPGSFLGQGKHPHGLASSPFSARRTVDGEFFLSFHDTPESGRIGFLSGRGKGPHKASWIHGIFF